MDGIQLTPWLEEKIRNGEAILFLGAGASKGALGPNGERPLNGLELRDVLSERFFHGALKDKPLAQVAEYAKTEASLAEVQKAISELFAPLEPANFHLLIPAFRWYAIITTNFDFIVERAYAKSAKDLQQLGTIIRDDDRFFEKIRDSKTVPYLKLHGCLSTINDPNLPLILATEEYARHRKGREKLFRHFQDWAREYPVIFCGYNIADPNIQQILFDLGDLGLNRPMYALIDPGLTEFDVRYWQSRRFVPIKATFEAFLNCLNAKIQEQVRVLSILRKRDASSIQSWVKKGAPSGLLLVYLDQELEHVRPGMAYQAIVPTDFYRGEANSWSPVAQDLDVKRRITDDLLIEAVLEKTNDRSPRLFLLKGYAGSGKSVTLRHFAWNAALEHKAFVFWLREGGVLRPELIRELYELTEEGPIVVIQDAIPHLHSIQALLKSSKKEGFPVTLVIGARSNEWNVAGGELDMDVNQSYELRDLSPKEIDSLIEKLDRHNCLGALKGLAQDECRQFFILSAERQLLVALHEATAGKSFEEIVLDEYNKIVPLEAQTLYLDVCTLHRFKVGLRAGLLSRVSGITFNYFRDRLFKPLEHLVQVYSDTLSRDYAYRTRHPVIADMVFRHVLQDHEKRANQVIRIVRSMNVDYESDNVAFEQLVRGRDLADLFADRVLADRIFEAALEASASVSHVEHQRAVFELHHPGGSSDRALKAIVKAVNATERPSQALIHTKAMILRKMASESSSYLEREKLRSDAKKILRRQIERGRSPHPFHTFGQILLDELVERQEKFLEAGEGQHLEERVISDLVADAEQVISEGLQHFPGGSYLLDLESQLARYLKDTPRAITALEKAFETTPGNGFVAVRLARQYAAEGNLERAKKVLAQCLENSPTSRIAHLQMAKYLIKEDDRQNAEVIRSHLKASFTPGDTNYDAQFWYARQEFLFGDKAKARELFQQLSKARVPPDVRSRARAEVLSPSGAPERFEGMTATVRDAFCFANIYEFGTDIFIPHTEFEEHDWERIRPNMRIRLGLAFNFCGPIGVLVGVIG